jgi:hypothetical protein
MEGVALGSKRSPDCRIIVAATTIVSIEWFMTQPPRYRTSGLVRVRVHAGVLDAESWPLVP